MLLLLIDETEKDTVRKLRDTFSVKDVLEINDTKEIVFPGLVINLEKRKVLKDGVEILFTTTEFEILRYLASQPGRVFTYRQIYEAIWNEEYACEKGSIMSHIQRIRGKIESDRQNPQYIENIRGVGYKFIEK